MATRKFPEIQVSPSGHYIIVDGVETLDYYQFRAPREAYEKNADRNHSIPSAHLDNCFLCNRPVDTRLTKWVHLCTVGGLYKNDQSVEDEYAGGNSQGMFPIGSECAKKLPSAYVRNAV